MSVLPAGVRLFASIALVTGTAACLPGNSIDGKYYNSRSGVFAMELKAGKVTYVQGQEGREMTYEVKGDSLVIHDPRGGFGDALTFGIEKDGTLSLGILGSLTKKRP